MQKASASGEDYPKSWDEDESVYVKGKAPENTKLEKTTWKNEITTISILLLRKLQNSIKEENIILI